MIDIPQPAQPAQAPAVPGQSLFPGSIPEPHSSGGNTVIPLPQTAGAAPPVAVGTISQLNVTNAAPESAQPSVQSENIAGSNPFADNAVDSIAGQANILNGQVPPQDVQPIQRDLTLPRSAADVFSAEGEDGGDSTTLTVDAASRLTAIFRPESSEEWKKAIQKAGQSQQQASQIQVGNTVTGPEGEIAGQTLSMKDAQAQLNQDKETSVVPAGNGTAARGRSDTVQSPSTASSSTMLGNDSADDHKVWKPRRTLRA